MEADEIVNRRDIILGRLSIACGLGLISLLCGCMDANTVVFVRKDGSGTVTETIMIRESLAPWTGTNQAAFTVAGNKARLADRASLMGQNVFLLSAEEVHVNGMIGLKAVYAFKDVRSLTVDMQPDVSLLGKLGPVQTDKRRPVTFGFGAKGDSLLINVPKTGVNEAVTSLPRPSNVPRNLAPEQRAVVRTMFAGFKIKLCIRIEGAIATTNASFIERGERNTVLLLDLDIEKLLEDDRIMDKLLAMGRIDDMDTARRKLAGLPDMRIEPADRIEIGFK